MFPNGNIVSERSKFNENVPAWELLAARGLDARKFPTGHIAAKGKAAKTKCARSGTRSVVIPARRLNFQSEFEINPPSRETKWRESRTHCDVHVRDHREHAQCGNTGLNLADAKRRDFAQNVTAWAKPSDNRLSRRRWRASSPSSRASGRAASNDRWRMPASSCAPFARNSPLARLEPSS